MKVREFTSNDYMGWAGVESLHPYIAESETMTCVVDDDQLQTFHWDEISPSGNEAYVALKFPSPGLALLAAMELRGDESSKEILALDVQKDIQWSP